MSLNHEGYTLAMMHVITYNTPPPLNLHHSPEIRNTEGNTVSMLMAKRSIIPP